MRRYCIQIIIIILSVLSLNSCNGSKQTIDNKEEIMKNSQPELSFAVSAQTKRFLSAFEKELNQKDLDSFKPSEHLIETYSIRKQNDCYFISGFIKIDTEFEQEKLKKIQVTSGSPITNIQTIQIPLKSLYLFLALQGIDYFEISEKSYTN